MGHHVSHLGLSTIKEKTEAIRNLDYPETLRQLDTGLGFFGYYRKFVPHYAAISKPLLDLKTKKFKGRPGKGKARRSHAEGTRLELPEACKRAWNELKDKLCNAPTLAFSDFDRDFILHCDGSKERGYGATLHQIDAEGVECPVLFLPKSLNEHEKRYWSTELEVRALVWALGKLKQYLDSNKVTVYTDHHAIRGLFHSKGPG